MRIADGRPIVFERGSKEPVELERVSTTDPSIAEHHIQRMVFDHPDLLPIQELDESFSPAIPIGREIRTEVGPIDALYASPSGGVTIVEAKLWRNPEARREVVGQIIDYATALSAWSYERLDEVSARATGDSLWSRVSSHAGYELPGGEAAFIDAVSRNLRHGRFLLLVVGDGIREEVERMASYVQTAPRLQFHLALVELRIYASDDGRLRAVIPSVVARTAEITRAVVRVNVAEEAKVEVDVTVPADDSASTRQKLTIDQYFEEMHGRATPDTVRFTRAVFQEFDADPRYHLDPKSASIVLRLRHPTGDGDFTVLVFKTDGQVYLGWLSGQCERAGVPRDVAFRFADDLSTIFGIPLHQKYEDMLAQPAPPEVVAEHWGEVHERIEELAQEIYSLPE